MYSINQSSAKCGTAVKVHMTKAWYMRLYGAPSDRSFHALDIRSEALITISLFRDVSSLCVCPLINDELRLNKKAVEPQVAGEWFREIYLPKRTDA